MIEISIIVPCFNEANNLYELCKRISSVSKKLNKSIELILIDDKSSDDTLAVIRRLRNNFKFIKCFYHKKNLGMAEAWRTGLNNANGKYTCLIDADLQYQPEDIIFLYNSVINNPEDLVQGYRSSVGRLKDSRFLLSRGLNLMLNILFSMHLKDNKSGFVLCKTETLKQIFNVRFHYKTFQTFLLVAAKKRKVNIREVEVFFLERLSGKSFIPKFPFKLISLVLFDFLKAFYEFKLSDKNVSLLSHHVNQTKIKEKVKSLDLFKKRNFFQNAILNIYFYTMPLHAWMISRNTKTYFKELEYSQWLSRKQILDLQFHKLQALLEHSYYHVPFYRKIFDNLSIKPSDIKSLDDLAKLPFLTKEIINDNLYSGILSDNHDKKKMLKIVTSGSTGSPFTCYADKFQLEMRWAATLRSMEWTDYTFGDKCARLWHQTIGMSLSQRVREKIDAILSRRIFIPAFSIDSGAIKKYMLKLKKFNPVLIDGYAESFNFLASYISSNPNFKIKPKALISSAQILPEQSRSIIESNFKTKVYDKYGSREFSGIAYQSINNEEHLVVAENYIVEIIKNNKKAKAGEIGEVVITDLNNYCMPFIRYKIGDLAKAVDPKKISACGRELPLIGSIQGRVQAIIIGSNKKFLPGAFFGHFFKEYPHMIKQYQVIQNKIGEIDLKIIKADRFNTQEMLLILNNLREFMGLNTKINIKYVKKIEMVRTGKHQGAISNIKINFQDIEN
jgi:phenylacetate-CoA ligase